MTPPNRDATRLYVIGDIHGRLDLLNELLEKIHRDIRQYPIHDCLTVTLGDYVDRGPDSRGVLDRLCRNPFPTRYVALKGNHEELLEMFLAEPKTFSNWRRLGGLETLHSYGISVGPLMMRKGFEQASRALQAALPPEHMQFLASLETSVVFDRYFLCHAGVRPGTPLARQRVEDLLWIREEFLNSGVDFGKIVIHGHTPVVEPEILPNRINIDTGAFATGRLTCLVLQGEQKRFLSTK
jgi:serine/threonine protein phosphatase 1